MEDQHQRDSPCSLLSIQAKATRQGFIQGGEGVLEGSRPLPPLKIYWGGGGGGGGGYPPTNFFTNRSKVHVAMSST